ncbi:MAG: helix-turn-helix transcriptional regulator [Clostridiales bacterium]|nr:helix-turn-helix transcriptional regulator [Clostridiales bacterium]
MNRLKQLRKERGFTQVKMQMLTGIDQSDYSKIESGKRYYTFEQCRRIAIALQTSMDYLAGLTDEKEPYPRINAEIMKNPENASNKN